MKNQCNPAGGLSAAGGGSIRLQPSSLAFSRTRDGEVAKAHILGDSFEMDLRVSGCDGRQSIPRSTASSPTSYLPDNLAISTLGIDDKIARFANPSSNSFLSKHTSESLPIEPLGGISGLMIFNCGTTSRMHEATPPSSYMSHGEVPALSSGRPRILVVDDEALYREVIAEMLGEEYEILFAANGMAALEIAVVKVPDLILLDVVMPGIDGYEVHKRLKADHRTCEVPVIFISGLGEVAAETKGLTLGAVDYITKPINREPVRARVRAQIMLKVAQDKLTQLAEIDGLTGLANRRHFDKMLAYECVRHQRSGHELSLIMLDIDHFKAFNDTYGHVRGDECLRMGARAMARTVSRATDLLARYGGEEFVALLPETPLKGAVSLAERVRNCISDLELPHRESNARHVTASLGVFSGRVLPGSSILDVVHEADIQLYAAKAAGRNRVSFRAIDASGQTH
jgi:diguanylate cyclase (GGDEF)-like protein